MIESNAKRLHLGLPKGNLQETTGKLFNRAGFALRISERSHTPDIADPPFDAGRAQRHLIV